MTFMMVLCSWRSSFQSHELALKKALSPAQTILSLMEKSSTVAQGRAVDHNFHPAALGSFRYAGPKLFCGLKIRTEILTNPHNTSVVWYIKLYYTHSSHGESKAQRKISDYPRPQSSIRIQESLVLSPSVQLFRTCCFTVVQNMPSPPFKNLIEWGNQSKTFYKQKETNKRSICMLGHAQFSAVC